MNNDLANKLGGCDELVNELSGWSIIDSLPSYAGVMSQFVTVYRNVSCPICKLKYEPKRELFTIVEWYGDIEDTYLMDRKEVIDMVASLKNWRKSSGEANSYKVEIYDVTLTSAVLEAYDNKESISYRIVDKVWRSVVYDTLEMVKNKSDHQKEVSVKLHTPAYTYTITGFHSFYRAEDEIILVCTGVEVSNVTVREQIFMKRLYSEPIFSVGDWIKMDDLDVMANFVTKVEFIPNQD